MLLAIQPGAIGDFILSLPALRALRLGPGAEGTEIWAERANLPLVEHPAYADRARPLGETGFDSYPLPARTLEMLRLFDTVVSWRGSGVTELVEAVTAVHPGAHFLRQLPPADMPIHLADFRRRQLSSLFDFGASARAALASPPRIFFREEDQEAAAKALGPDEPGRPLVVVHPGASSKRKRWPAAAFAELAAKLRSGCRARIVLTEGPLDRDAVQEVCSAGIRPAVWSAGVSPAPGSWEVIRVANLRHLAAVLRRAVLFAGNDTGIAHLAAAAGAPTLVIFTCTDPDTWAPRGPQVQTLVNPQVGEALRAAGAFLQA